MPMVVTPRFVSGNTGTTQTVTATVTDAAGSPVVNTLVQLGTVGANAQQLAGTTDAAGKVAFSYAGAVGGTDTAQAVATVAGVSLYSNMVGIQWNGGAPVSIPVIQLTASVLSAQLQGNSQTLSARVLDATGAVVPNAVVTLYLYGANAQGPVTIAANASGVATFTYQGTNAGTDSAQASAVVNTAAALSGAVDMYWTAPAPGSVPPSLPVSGNLTLVSSVSAAVATGTSVTLTATLKDSSGALVSGGAVKVLVQGANTRVLNAVTNASGVAVVSYAGAVGGIDMAQASAVVTGAQSESAAVYVTWLGAAPAALPAGPVSNSGWIGSPVNGSTVTGVVPVTVAAGTSLTGGTLTVTPVYDTTRTTVLTPSASGSGTIGALDTTLLQNGAYWIQLVATDSTGKSQTSLSLVNVIGEYKPGRVTATVTDLTVPATGLAIQIQRTYDSLTRNSSMDFGYGWRLGINVQLEVDPSGNVTMTLNGRRRTFYLTPQSGGIFGYWYLPAYTAEPGFYGSLSTTGDNCSGLLVRAGNMFQCAISNAGSQYQASGYQYRDPYGRVYTIGSDGQLQSLKDLNGNTLTVSPSGITSTTGLSVPFVRDTQGRITQITDPLGNAYNYTYDGNGNLSTLTLPPSPPTVLLPVTYTGKRPRNPSCRAQPRVM